MTFRALANPEWFFTAPTRAWGFYGYRYNLYKQTTPHRGFLILKHWQASKSIPGFVYTSNVDGHFQKAGFAPEQVYECHGSINHLQCSMVCNDRIWPLESLPFEIDVEKMVALGPLPLCPECGCVARPNILMFDDGDWLDPRANLQMQRYFEWLKAAFGKNIVVIEIGAGSKVGGIRYVGEKTPGTLIRINPNEPQGPEGIISLAMPALEAIDAIDEMLETCR